MSNPVAGPAISFKAMLMFLPKELVLMDDMFAGRRCLSAKPPIDR